MILNILIDKMNVFQLTSRCWKEKQLDLIFSAINKFTKLYATTFGPPFFWEYALIVIYQD